MVKLQTTSLSYHLRAIGTTFITLQASSPSPESILRHIATTRLPHSSTRNVVKPSTTRLWCILSTWLQDQEVSGRQTRHHQFQSSTIPSTTAIYPRIHRRISLSPSRPAKCPPKRRAIHRRSSPSATEKHSRKKKRISCVASIFRETYTTGE
jgi:hypothetical protein